MANLDRICFMCVRIWVEFDSMFANSGQMGLIRLDLVVNLDYRS